MLHSFGGSIPDDKRIIRAKGGTLSREGGDLIRQDVYVCRHCGNLVAMLRDKGVPIVCCHEKMAKVIPDSTAAAGEKHAPVYTREGNTVHVTVGAVEHPMSQEHWIEWICLETQRGIQYVWLTPEDRPQAVFSLCEGDEVQAVYAFCNQHELWGN